MHYGFSLILIGKYVIGLICSLHITMLVDNIDPHPSTPAVVLRPDGEKTIPSVNVFRTDVSLCFLAEFLLDVKF